MSEKKELTRADLVRLRRESENSQRRERAKKEATRPVPTVTTRAKPAAPKPKRWCCRWDFPGSARDSESTPSPRFSLRSSTWAPPSDAYSPRR